MGLKQRLGKLRRRRKAPSYDGGAVGTEAAAKENIERNAKTFKYPEEGFVTPIEHGLLYACLKEPKIFPAETVLEMIEDEDFSQYLVVKEPSSGSPLPVKEEKVSYAQLTALLGILSDLWDQKSRVPEILYRDVVRCVTRHAETHGLDRKTEVDELLQPMIDYTMRKKEKARMMTAIWLAYYGGQAGLALFASPLSIIVFSATYNAATLGVVAKEIIGKNLNSVKRLTDRTADTEQVSLLDECHDPAQYDLG